MSSQGDWGKLRLFVIVLLVLQLVAVVFAWLINPVGQRSETEFALLLAANLVAFSLVSYISRLGSVGANPRGAFVLGGSGAVLIFMFLLLLI